MTLRRDLRHGQWVHLPLAECPELACGYWIAIPGEGAQLPFCPHHAVRMVTIIGPDRQEFAGRLLSVDDAIAAVRAGLTDG